MRRKSYVYIFESAQKELKELLFERVPKGQAEVRLPENQLEPLPCPEKQSKRSESKSEANVVKRMKKHEEN